MDPTVDPCDNFYNFVCGNFVKNSNLLNKEAQISTMENSQKNINEQLRTIASEPLRKDDILPYRLVKEYYSQCMNEEKLRKNGIKEFLRITERYGGWPILMGEKWDENKFEWKNFISELQNYTTNNFLFNLKLTKNKKMIGIRLFNTIPRKFQIFRSEIDDFLHLFGDNRQDNSDDLDDIMNFQIQLEIINYDPDVIRNIIYLKEFQKQNNYLNWTEHINRQLSKNDKLNEMQFIIIEHLNYFRELGELIETTPKRTLANYLFWNFAKFLAPYLTSEIHDTKAKLDNQRITSRWEFCMQEITTK